ncbi:hypothetical protein LCGC14_3144910, partial [marine sediment metagenome]
TETRALLDGSSAIDAGSSDGSPTDQRGVPRPQGPASDIGAFESCDSENDTDCDGLSDAYEEAHACLNPSVDDGASDPDGDGLTNVEEFSLGTDPCSSDTDLDGCTDREELGGDETLGGKRDPLNFWDFYDVTGPTGRDGKVDLRTTSSGLRSPSAPTRSVQASGPSRRRRGGDSGGDTGGRRLWRG